MDSYILISAILLALQENSRPELGVVTFPFMLHRKAVCFVLRVKAPQLPFRRSHPIGLC